MTELPLDAAGRSRSPAMMRSARRDNALRQHRPDRVSVGTEPYAPRFPVPCDWPRRSSSRKAPPGALPDKLDSRLGTAVVC